MAKVDEDPQMKAAVSGEGESNSDSEEDGQSVDENEPNAKDDLAKIKMLLETLQAQIQQLSHLETTTSPEIFDCRQKKRNSIS
ncbi:unnamed protein product [Amaranthus hypochondriacus]